MADKYIKDKYGAPIGFTRDIGNEIQAFHITKGLLGRYVKSSDITFSTAGGIYCFGDGTSDMIREAERNK